jgi:hypothetical protein
MLRQNGISASEQSDMLRLDAMVMMVQLNIRNLLEARVGDLQTITAILNAASTWLDDSLIRMQAV